MGKERFSDGNLKKNGRKEGRILKRGKGTKG